MSAQPASPIKACLGAIALLAVTGLMAAEPAPAGTEGTKDENFTNWQQVRSSLPRVPLAAHAHPHRALAASSH